MQSNCFASLSSPVLFKMQTRYVDCVRECMSVVFPPLQDALISNSTVPMHFHRYLDSSCLDNPSTMEFPGLLLRQPHSLSFQYLCINLGLSVKMHRSLISITITFIYLGHHVHSLQLVFRNCQKDFYRHFSHRNNFQTKIQSVFNQLQPF